MYTTHTTHVPHTHTRLHTAHTHIYTHSCTQNKIAAQDKRYDTRVFSWSRFSLGRGFGSEGGVRGCKWEEWGKLCQSGTFSPPSSWMLPLPLWALKTHHHHGNSLSHYNGSQYLKFDLQQQQIHSLINKMTVNKNICSKLTSKKRESLKKDNSTSAKWLALWQWCVSGWWLRLSAGMDCTGGECQVSTGAMCAVGLLCYMLASWYLECFITTPQKYFLGTLWGSDVEEKRGGERNTQK